jgi:hypothetical protein
VTRTARAIASSVAAGLLTGAALLAPSAASALSLPPIGSSVLFGAGAQAPVLQVTEDEPNAQFHPEGEGEYGYSYASLSPSSQFALATLVWPGSAAGNAGSLVEVLTGNGSLGALNDPVRAQATSGRGSTSQSTSTPTGTEMSASVQPPQPNEDLATALARTAGGGLGAIGSVGSSTSSTTIRFDPSVDVLTATSSSVASDLEIDGGLISIGSLRSSVSGATKGGAPAQVSGSVDVADMKVAGQSAYIDGSGLHLGRPGSPAGAPQQDAVNAALTQAGMQIYFTTPRQLTLAGNTYYYGASVLFSWAPPGDTSHNVFTASIGGAAVSMAATSAGGGFSCCTSSAPPAGLGTSSSGTSGAIAPSQTAQPITRLALPTNAPSSQPANLAPSVAPPQPSTGSLASVALPAGLGAGWWVLIILAGFAGAVGLTKIPGALARSATGGCPQGRPTPDKTKEPA